MFKLKRRPLHWFTSFSIPSCLINSCLLICGNVFVPFSDTHERCILKRNGYHIRSDVWQGDVLWFCAYLFVPVHHLSRGLKIDHQQSWFIGICTSWRIAMNLRNRRIRKTSLKVAFSFAVSYYHLDFIVISNKLSLLLDIFICLFILTFRLYSYWY